LDELEKETGLHIVTQNGKEQRRDVQRSVCMWEKLTGTEVLEETELPFSGVPIFPVLGDEIVLDGKTMYESAVRHARDPQRSYNYWRTAAAETVALAPRAPWVLTQRQLDGHEHEFEAANRDNLPYITYNHQDGVAPPQRNFPSNVAAAELSNANQDAQDMQSIIGLHEASLGAQGNEKSGKAINARKEQGNTATYQFPDSLNQAMEQMCRLALEAIPKLYDTQRITRIKLPDDTEDFIEINKSVYDEDTKEDVLINDLGFGKYDAVVETGPNYLTQRQEAAELQMELLRVLGPDQARNIVHLIVDNMGLPGAAQVAEVLRKMLPDELKDPDDIDRDLPDGVTRDEEGNLVVLKLTSL
jgi:hypothetical protein